MSSPTTSCLRGCNVRTSASPKWPALPVTKIFIRVSGLWPPWDVPSVLQLITQKDFAHSFHPHYHPARFAASHWAVSSTGCLVARAGYNKRSPFFPVW